MIGTIGCSPGMMLNFRSVIAARKNFVFASSRSRSSVERRQISSALSEAPTIGGATEFENRYGRDRWRSIATISDRPLV